MLRHVSEHGVEGSSVDRCLMAEMLIRANKRGQQV